MCRFHLSLAVIVGSLALVKCYPTFQNRIPNGAQIPNPCSPGEAWAAVGHKVPGAGRGFNSFGEAFEANGKQWDIAICKADSDGDGATNGEEVGDPDCIWSGSGPAPSEATGHPGICEPVDSPNCQRANSFLSSTNCAALVGVEPVSVDNSTSAGPPGFEKIWAEKSNCKCFCFDEEAFGEAMSEMMESTFSGLFGMDVDDEDESESHENYYRKKRDTWDQAWQHMQQGNRGLRGIANGMNVQGNAHGNANANGRFQGFQGNFGSNFGGNMQGGRPGDHLQNEREEGGPNVENVPEFNSPDTHDVMDMCKCACPKSP